MSVLCFSMKQWYNQQIIQLFFFPPKSYKFSPSLSSRPCERKRSVLNIRSRTISMITKQEIANKSLFIYILALESDVLFEDCTCPLVVETCILIGYNDFHLYVNTKMYNKIPVPITWISIFIHKISKVMALIDNC